MANTTAWAAAVPKSTGERVTAAEFNALDDGMVAAITRGGTTTLTSEAVVDGGGLNFDFTDAVVRVNSLNNLGYQSALSFVRQQTGASLSTTNFAYNLNPYAYCQTAATGVIVIPCDNIPDGATITGASVIFMGAVPSVGPNFAALPAGMPSFKLYKTSPSAGTASSLGTATDATAVLATFNAAHTVSLTGLNEVVTHSDNYRYVIEVTGAFGANYVNGMGVLATYLTMTTTKIKP